MTTNDEKVTLALENEFDGVDTFDIVRELLGLRTKVSNLTAENAKLIERIRAMDVLLKGKEAIVQAGQERFDKDSQRINNLKAANKALALRNKKLEKLIMIYDKDFKSKFQPKPNDTESPVRQMGLPTESDPIIKAQVLKPGEKET